jgi:hypothetical protein
MRGASEGAKRLGLTNLPVIETTEECDLALGTNHCGCGSPYSMWKQANATAFYYKSKVCKETANEKRPKNSENGPCKSATFPPTCAMNCNDNFQIQNRKKWLSSRQ